MPQSKKKSQGDKFKEAAKKAEADDNQGRVSELNTGKFFVGLAPASHLPADFPPLA